MEEKRCVTRWEIVLCARYAGMTTHGVGVCNTSDINMLGARLMMPERHNQGDRIALLLDVPYKVDGRPADIGADIVWQEDGDKGAQEVCFATGVLFTRISDRDRKSILDYISTYYARKFRQNWWCGLK